MKLTTSILLSLTFILSSCKSDEAEVTPAEPSVETEVKAEPNKEAPAVAIKVAPKAELVAKPKKMTVAELAADIENNPKAVAKKIAGLQNELADVMETISDKDTADQALFDIEPIIDDLSVLGQAMVGMENQPDEELKAELQKIASAPRERLQKAGMQAAPVFMSDPTLMTKLQGTMRKLMEASKAGQ
ncbi:hypothetical protein N9Z15_01555 [Akkermansiaceae bacterium]|nr:hypothetical protein [Akkermansiaceae bacterium]